MLCIVKDHFRISMKQVTKSATKFDYNIQQHHTYIHKLFRDSTKFRKKTKQRRAVEEPKWDIKLTQA